MPSSSEVWRDDRTLGPSWDIGVKVDAIGRVLGKAAFATDTRVMWRHIAALGDLPPGTSVLDVPCGGGTNFRVLEPGQRLDYVAADYAPGMVRRARKEAGKRGLDWIDVVEADALDLPYEDARFDVVATYMGIHCMPDAHRALAEMARVLKPGGELRGSTLVTGTGRRQDLWLKLNDRRGIFGEISRLGETERWLEDAGYVLEASERSGCIYYFSCRRTTS